MRTSFVALPLTLALALLPSALPAAEDLKAREEAALKVSDQLLATMKEALTKELAAGGPVTSIKACSQVAPDLAGKLSREKGWKITRIGTRVRNPMLGTPDAWEQQVLSQFADRLKKGEKLETLTFSEKVQEPAGSYFRTMKAIGLAPQCIVCHGSSTEVAEPIQAMLKEQYPHDQAIGYRPGELRGAVSIKQPLP